MQIAMLLLFLLHAGIKQKVLRLFQGPHGEATGKRMLMIQCMITAALNLSDITSKISTVGALLIINTQEMFLTSNGASIVAIKLEAKFRFRTEVVALLLTFKKIL
jgi:hypothetical protein